MSNDVDTTIQADHANSVSAKTIFAVLFYILAAILAIAGIATAYSDADVVGGDAFNFIIGAGRGAAWVGVAVVTAIIALGLQIAGRALRKGDL